MTRVLVHAYDVKRDHLDAYDVEALIVPAIVDEKTWVPELDREDLLYHRLFLAEKWLVLKLRYGHADPRDAGVGNIVNCGAAMYIAPVGIANAGDPRRAYDEALDLTAAHQSSYGREAAGVLAAAVAAAMQVDATPETVVETCLALAKDGTRTAIEAVADAAAKLDGWRDGGLAELRRAFAPFDSVGEHYATPALNARIPSRLHAIEELPIALGLLVATGGDYEETVLGGVNYGRDSDSIASMGGALAGALGNPLRRDWVDDVSAASKIDVEDGGPAHGRRRRGDLRQGPPAPPGAGAGTGRAHRRRGTCLRVTWVQPEDLVGHELRQAREEGKDVDDVEERWFAAGGAPAPGRGASQEPVAPELRSLALDLLDELDALPRPLAAAEPDGFEEILAAADPAARQDARDLPERIAGRVARPRGRLRARQAGREHPPRRDPRDRRGDGQLAGARLVHGRGPAGGGLGALAVEPRQPTDEPRREHRRDPRGRRPQLHDARRRAARALRHRLRRARRRQDLARLHAARADLHRRAGRACGTCSRPTCRPRPRRGATPSASGSAPGCASTRTAGRLPATRSPRRGWRGRTRALSHTANGVYAAMFMAAAHAASVAGSSPAACADAGVSVVPAESRLAESLRTARELAGLAWEEAVDELYARYDSYHWVHAINNTALVAAALYAFDDDFSGAISAVVQGGWDTDTNGAAVGSIVGAAVGVDGIEERWSAPLGGRFTSSLPGFDGITLDELVRRTIAVAGAPAAA